eukprot:scaffold244_cov416-Prasinococcus_capsulatus_cf.AAC.12
MWQAAEEVLHQSLNHERQRAATLERNLEAESVQAREAEVYRYKLKLATGQVEELERERHDGRAKVQALEAEAVAQLKRAEAAEARATIASKNAAAAVAECKQIEEQAATEARELLAKAQATWSTQTQQRHEENTTKLLALKEEGDAWRAKAEQLAAQLASQRQVPEDLAKTPEVRKICCHVEVSCSKCTALESKVNQLQRTLRKVLDLNKVMAKHYAWALQVTKQSPPTSDNRVDEAWTPGSSAPKPPRPSTRFASHAKRAEPTKRLNGVPHTAEETAQQDVIQQIEREIASLNEVYIQSLANSATDPDLQAIEPLLDRIHTKSKQLRSLRVDV